MTKVTGFDKADRFTRGLEDLENEARETGHNHRWFYAHEIAFRAAIHDTGYMARRRRVNRVLSLFNLERSDIPSKAPFPTYRGPEATASLSILESSGIVASIDGYIADIPGDITSLHRPAKLYRLIPEEPDPEAERPVRRDPGTYIM